MSVGGSIGMNSSPPSPIATSVNVIVPTETDVVHYPYIEALDAVTKDPILNPTDCPMHSEGPNIVKDTYVLPYIQ